MTLPAPLRIGVLGCAGIARSFIRDVKASALVSVDAVASRTPGKAAAFAKAHGVGRHHGSYDALLADPEIDAIYNPLPNSLHAAWSIRAAQAGKHVLCEKPLATSAADARAMFDAARRANVMLLEAYPYEFQPQTEAMLEALGNGAIGVVRSAQACFGFTLTQPDGNIRMDPVLGGGALLDVGSYCLSLVRLAMGCAPREVIADSSWTESGVDVATVATLRYADGRRAQISCAMNAASHRRAILIGSGGTLETEFLNHTSDTASGHPLGFQRSQLRVRRGTANAVPFEEITSKSGSGFLFAAEFFARMVASNDVAAMERHAAASLDNMATLEAIGRSARSERPELVR